MKKRVWPVGGVLLLLLLVTSGCIGPGEGAPRFSQAVSAAGPEEQPSQPETIRLVLPDNAFDTHLVRLLRDELLPAGYLLVPVTPADSIEANRLVDEGKADFNLVQHVAYFNQFVSDHHMQRLVRGFYAVSLPGGLYSKTYSSLGLLPAGSVIAIPAEAADNGRALVLLQQAGLLQLKPGVEVSLLGLKDIVANPLGLQFRELPAAQLPAALEQTAAGFLPAEAAVDLGFDPQRDALALETDPESPFRSIVAARRELAGSRKLQELQRAFAAESVQALYRLHYGGVVQLPETGASR